MNLLSIKKQWISEGYSHIMSNLIRLLSIVLVVCLTHFTANALGQKVTINKKNINLKTVFSEIQKQTGYIVLVQSELLRNTNKYDLNFQNSNLTEVLNTVLKNENLNYSIEDKSIVIFRATKKQNDKINHTNTNIELQEIKGQVLDVNGVALQGVTITVQGKNTVTYTDEFGNFSISASVNDILVFRILGYESKEFTITANAPITVNLSQVSNEIDQVVVTALGIKRDERSLGYSVQKVQGASLTEAKGVNVATSLTGKVAGLNVRNSTEFGANPSLLLRGEEALLVIDGVPYSSLSLDNLAPDDILEISVLKGATASALYGSRGANGAIMITTKKGFKHVGLDISINSSTMFSSGFVAFPEVQTSYSSGGAGKYAVGDYVWGDKLDIGRKAVQYNPFEYKFEEQDLVSKGKDNLSNFLRQGFITNNNVSVAQSTENGSYRASINHVHNKGQYPNTKLNKIIGSLAGEIKFGDFNLEGGFSFQKRFFPNNYGAGYGGGGYMYNLVIWSGTEYDIRDYANYWVEGKENIAQNWMETNWYDNPYFIANEILRSNDYNLTNGYINGSYQITPWLKAMLRTGVDTYSQNVTWRNPISAVGGWNRRGYYSITKSDQFSINNDFILSAAGSFGDFNIDGLLGGSIYYRKFNSLNSETQNGITVPGFYSLKASVDPVKSTPETSQRQDNSIYSKLSVAYKNIAYLDLTGRNDWASTLSADERSYFYPSVSGSFVFTELLNMPSWFNSGRLRASWAETKKIPGIYEINNNYIISTNVWDGISASAYPSVIRPKNILPQTDRSLEYGAALMLLNNRLQLDLTYFDRLYYNRIISAQVSTASGFSNVLINTNEEIVRKGIEFAGSGDIIRKKDFSWNLGVNFATNKRYYASLDSIYSPDKPWVKEGNRYDHSTNTRYDYTADGKAITQNGFPIKDPKEVVIGYGDPNWIWGFNNNFKYKDFNLAFSFDGRVGGLAYNNMEGYMWSSGVHIDSDNEWRYDEVVNGNKSYLVEGVQVKSGTTTRDVYGNIITDTREYEPNTTKVSYEQFVRSRAAVLDYYNQTFIKLRELSLTYQLPKSIINPIGMKNASVGVVGQNLWLWTKEWNFSDPDVNGDNLNSPSIRYVGFNIKANF